MSIVREHSVGGKPVLEIPVALKNGTSNAKVIFKMPIRYSVMFKADGLLSKKEFIGQWRGIDDSSEVTGSIRNLKANGMDAISSALKQHRCNHSHCIVSSLMSSSLLLFPTPLATFLILSPGAITRIVASLL